MLVPNTLVARLSCNRLQGGIAIQVGIFQIALLECGNNASRPQSNSDPLSAQTILQAAHTPQMPTDRLTAWHG
jgi:hypothetical protein